MIETFADKETARIFNREFARRLPQAIQHVARRKLEVLNAAEAVADLRNPPTNQLEKLSGNRKGQYSIRINDQWRICFTWHNGNAEQVEIVDYH